MRTDHELNLDRIARQRGATAESRADALSKGLRFYRGAPCKRCNDTQAAVRYASNRKCTYCNMIEGSNVRYDRGPAALAMRARKRAYRAQEHANRRLKRAQAKAAQLAQVPDGMTSPMAQLLGTILSTDG